MKRIAILGSTGSIGRSALAVVEAHPERLTVTALAAGRNAALFAEEVEHVRPRAIAMASEATLLEVKQSLRAQTCHRIVMYAHGSHGMAEIATRPDVDLVLCASSGTAALEALLAAIECGKTIALAEQGHRRGPRPQGRAAREERRHLDSGGRDRWHADPRLQPAADGGASRLGGYVARRRARGRAPWCRLRGVTASSSREVVPSAA